MSDATDVTVTDVPDESRFEARSGGDLVGEAVYRRDGDLLVFTHTRVDDELEGRGVGSQLVREALDAVRAAGGQVVPQCPFVAAWIDRHEDYADLVRTPDR